MNKGLLSVDEALEVLLAGARPVREVESVDALDARGRVSSKVVVEEPVDDSHPLA